MVDSVDAHGRALPPGVPSRKGLGQSATPLPSQRSPILNGPSVVIREELSVTGSAVTRHRSSHITSYDEFAMNAATTAGGSVNVITQTQ